MLAARRLAASAPSPPSSSSPLLRRGLSAQPQPATPPPAADDGAGAWARSAAALSLLGLTGAVAASAVSDLSVFLSCSSQAIEKATQNQQIVNAIGKPIVRGPWYNASIAVNHARHSVSCTFPCRGLKEMGFLSSRLFAWVRSDWEILLMDAILDVPTDDGKHQTIRVTIPDNTIAPPPVDCRACKPQPTLTPPPEK